MKIRVEGSRQRGRVPVIKRHLAACTLEIPKMSVAQSIAPRPHLPHRPYALLQPDHMGSTISTHWIKCSWSEVLSTVLLWDHL